MPVSEYRLATYTIALLLGALVSYLLTPIVRELARRFDFVDRPGGRKTQATAVALGGGIAVFGATLAAVVGAYVFSDWSVPQTFVGNDAPLLAGLAAAATATLALGLYDDAADLRGRYKLIGQLIIVSLLVYLGLQIDRFSFFGREISLGWMTIPFSIFWLVGATNAINLLDGIDGLASSIGMVLCLTFAAINGIYGHFPEAVVMLALAGALFGFLRYNFAPASIYLGDAGSMVIGLVIGAIAVQTHTKTPAFIAMTIPLAVWAIPILDSGAAIVRRRLTGRSIFAPDRGHLHHSLLTRGWSVRQASTFIALVCATTCISAVLGVLWHNEWIVVGTVFLVVAFLISTRTFGHIEFALLRERMRLTGLSLRKDESHHNLPRHGAVRLQGNHEWEVVWEALVEAAPDYRLTKLQLTIHMPRLHEAFFGNWKADKTTLAEAKSEASWKATLPLIVDGEPVGKLQIAGIADPDARSTPAQLGQVLDFLEPLEDDIRQVREQAAARLKKPSGSAEAKPAPSPPHEALVETTSS
ncbi:glycosyltransferase family 4 protein [Botrimarina hoheduenensis]|uniref:WecA-like glycosyltransferase n=1 Tax=Botrimarina hoheduenensis TaxID=2528000 RepID=A0A5C5W9S0_9BACT|nr:MraY family glycosyltransferase [Botrimarina hoheduenensis]TWT46771.1 WecA-like glycosyltransferase [Botrimarina hoheduenensis]